MAAKKIRKGRANWRFWPSGPKRRRAAQKAEEMRQGAKKAWAMGAYANRRRKSPRHGMSWAEYYALMGVARVRAEELVDKLLENE